MAFASAVEELAVEHARQAAAAAPERVFQGLERAVDPHRPDHEGPEQRPVTRLVESDFERLRSHPHPFLANTD